MKLGKRLTTCVLAFVMVFISLPVVIVNAQTGLATPIRFTNLWNGRTISGNSFDVRGNYNYGVDGLYITMRDLTWNQRVLYNVNIGHVWDGYFSFNINNLRPGHRYRVAILATNHSDNSREWAYVEFNVALWGSYRDTRVVYGGRNGYRNAVSAGWFPSSRSVAVGLEGGLSSANVRIEGTEYSIRETYQVPHGTQLHWYPRGYHQYPRYREYRGRQNNQYVLVRWGGSGQFLYINRRYLRFPIYPNI